MLQQLMMAVLVGLILAGTWWYHAEAPFLPQESPVEAPVAVAPAPPLTTYTAEILGLAFTYPTAWGEVVTTEVEPYHYHLSFSLLRSGEGEGRPAPFAAYRLPEYVASARGGYWGDLVTQPPATACSTLAGATCAVDATAVGIRYAQLTGTPTYCEAEGAVTAQTYLVPARPDQTVVAPAIVFNDEAVVSGEDCFTTDTAKAAAFAAMVASITYVD